MELNGTVVCLCDGICYMTDRPHKLVRFRPGQKKFSSILYLSSFQTSMSSHWSEWDNLMISSLANCWNSYLKIWVMLFVCGFFYKGLLYSDSCCYASSQCLLESDLIVGLV